MTNPDPLKLKFEDIKLDMDLLVNKNYDVTLAIIWQNVESSKDALMCQKRLLQNEKIREKIVEILAKPYHSCSNAERYTKNILTNSLGDFLNE